MWPLRSASVEQTEVRHSVACDFITARILHANSRLVSINCCIQSHLKPPLSITFTKCIIHFRKRNALKCSHMNTRQPNPGKARGYRDEISISLHWQFDNGIETLHFVGVCDYTEANHCAARPFAHSSQSLQVKNTWEPGSPTTAAISRKLLFHGAVVSQKTDIRHQFMPLFS